MPKTERPRIEVLLPEQAAANLIRNCKGVFNEYGNLHGAGKNMPLDYHVEKAKKDVPKDLANGILFVFGKPDYSDIDVGKIDTDTPEGKRDMEYLIAIDDKSFETMSLIEDVLMDDFETRVKLENKLKILRGKRLKAKGRQLDELGVQIADIEKEVTRLLEEERKTRRLMEQAEQMLEKLQLPKETYLARSGFLKDQEQKAEKAEGLENKVDRYERTIEARMSEIDRLIDWVARAEAEINKIRSATRTKISTVTELPEVDELTEQMIALNTKREVLERMLDRLYVRIASLEDEIETIDRQLGEVAEKKKEIMPKVAPEERHLRIVRGEKEKEAPEAEVIPISAEKERLAEDIASEEGAEKIVRELRKEGTGGATIYQFPTREPNELPDQPA